MYQESDDKLKGSSKTDTFIFIALVVFFLIAGTVATVLRSKLSTDIPLYALAALFGGLLYLVYRLRIVGWRYTVFYKEPETEYDPRFDEYITHEDHPYPVGTLVFEKTVSAKGQIMEVVKKEELKALLEPGEEYAADSERVLGPRKKELSSSVVFERDGKVCRIYFTPSEEYKGYVRGILAEQ